jgi:hypothetical protein
MEPAQALAGKFVARIERELVQLHAERGRSPATLALGWRAARLCKAVSQKCLQCGCRGAAVRVVETTKTIVCFLASMPAVEPSPRCDLSLLDLLLIVTRAWHNCSRQTLSDSATDDGVKAGRVLRQLHTALVAQYASLGHCMGGTAVRASGGGGDDGDEEEEECDDQERWVEWVATPSLAPLHLHISGALSRLGHHQFALESAQHAVFHTREFCHPEERLCSFAVVGVHAGRGRPPADGGGGGGGGAGGGDAELYSLALRALAALAEAHCALGERFRLPSHAAAGLAARVTAYKVLLASKVLLLASTGGLSGPTFCDTKARRGFWKSVSAVHVKHMWKLVTVHESTHVKSARAASTRESAV